ncbi:PhoD-like phosphatase N-terminal domain-containing protein [Haladaptatus sp.]|uniref:PhoD-like phosphatase N-terminal domain-containing protein n=1 Tax=Haladaptatus sp. TaxID=1973141 RepID=UPI003C4D4B3B
MHVFSYDVAADADATFPQSVMSGGPTDSGAIVWTRIGETAYREGQPVEVQVANDETLDDPVFEGVVDASAMSATHDYTVKVDLDGELDADRFYYYRFIYDGTASRTGRLQTMPLTAGEDWYQVEFLEDSWDGFQAERAELMNAVDDASLRNFVTLTGDLHCSMAGYQHAGYGEASWNRDTVGIEFMTPSIRSVCAADVVDFPGDWDREALAAIAKAENEHLEYVNWYEHGYFVIEFTETDCEFTVYGVDADENSADAKKRTLAQYRVPDGELSLEALSEPKTVSRS